MYKINLKKVSFLCIEKRERGSWKNKKITIWLEKNLKSLFIIHVVEKKFSLFWLPQKKGKKYNKIPWKRQQALFKEYIFLWSRYLLLFIIKRISQLIRSFERKMHKVCFKHFANIYGSQYRVNLTILSFLI